MINERIRWELGKAMKKKEQLVNGSIHQQDGKWYMWCGQHRVRIRYVYLEGCDKARCHRVADRSEAEGIGEAAARASAGLHADGEG